MVVTTVTTGDYQYSFEDLARELRTPGTTLRRYFKVFQQFIPNKTVNRATKFDNDARQLFDDINKMYKQRMSTAEILQALAATRTPTLDVRPSPPAQAAAPPARQQMDLESLAALIPLAERFVVALETIAARMPVPGAIGGPQDAFKASGQGLHHPDHQKGQDKPVGDVVDRGAVIARVIELHGEEGLGQHAITTRVRREGLRMSARGQLSKSTVARIIKGDIKS